MLSKFQMIGRITQDVELYQTNNNTPTAKIGLAVNNGEDTYFFNIMAYDKKAELACKYLTKGKQVYIDGTIKRKSYVKNGNTYNVIDLTAQNIEFLSSGSQGNKEEDLDMPF